MTTLPGIKIRVGSLERGDNYIEIDGHRIPKVHTIAFRSTVNKLTTVQIGMYAGDVTVELPDGAEIALNVDQFVEQAKRQQVVETTDLSRQGVEHR